VAFVQNNTTTTLILRGDYISGSRINSLWAIDVAAAITSTIYELDITKYCELLHKTKTKVGLSSKK